MFPRVANSSARLSPKEFVAASGEQIKDLGEKNYSIQDKRGIFQRFITLRMCEHVAKPVISMQKRSPELETLSVLDEKNPHIRKIRD